jgi:hypothetical protein
MRWLVLLPLLVACKPREAAESDTAPEPNPYCDPRVLVPQISGVPTDTADPHAETFGATLPDPFQVRIQWPGSDPSRSVSFLWRTDVDTLATVVEWGEGTSLDQRTEGASFGLGAASPPVARIHEVRLCGDLKPATTYSYRVGGDGHWSPTYTFTTPGEPGSFDTFRVAYAGDSRGTFEAWGTMLTQMEAEDPDFITFSGDMVDIGLSQDDWDGWFDAAGDVLAEIPLVPAHGNHEFLSPSYFAQFSMPGNEEWFDIRYGNLTLVSLNDTVRDLAVLTEDEIQLMDEAWGANPDDWKVAMHHQSIYSRCTTHGSYMDLREAWGPVFDRHDVDVVFAGHNHIYERSVPIRGDALAEDGAGTVYLVSGGAGAPLYTGVADEWYGAVANPIEHWVMADFSPDRIDFVVKDLSGNVIDSFTIPRD